MRPRKVLPSGLKKDYLERGNFVVKDLTRVELDPEAEGAAF